MTAPYISLIPTNDNLPVYMEIHACEFCDHDQFTGKGKHLVCNFCGFIKVFR